MQNSVNISHDFSKKMRYIAVMMGCFIALTMPITYFVLSWVDQKTKSEYLSKQISQKIIGIVKVNPKLWKYSVVKFTQVFSEVESEEIKQIQIYDSLGRMIDDQSYSRFAVLTCKGRSDIIYNNTFFGYVEVRKIANDTLLISGILFLIFSLLAAIIAYILFHYPARIIEKAQVEINNSMDRLNAISYFDSVTQLRNRTFLDEMFPKITTDSNKFTLLFLDLDNFKHINDSYGHIYGDLLLVEVSERLKKNVRLNDIVIRFGGDEFMIILFNIHDHASVKTITDKLMNAFMEPINLNEIELFITASIGIVIYPEDGKDLTQLVKHADTAMYSAKKNGKNNYCFYTNEMSTESIERMDLVNELHKAIDGNEFVLYFQPKFDLNNRKITGCEILIRWLHPERGIIAPGEFIPLAEETGLIIPIGDWLIQESIHQIKDWVNQYKLEFIRFSINISPRQFLQDNLIVNIKNELDKVGLNPQYIEVEITESIAMQNTDVVYEKLSELKSIGVAISIDDFGTGYSSMSYLKKFPIDTIKIAMPFVQDIKKGKGNDAIISAIVSLSHNLGMDVIAEGIETEEQLEVLREKKCDYGQGYLFSRPVPAEDFIHLLIKQEAKIMNN